MSFSPLVRRIFSSPQLGAASPVVLEPRSESVPPETYPTDGEISAAKVASKNLLEKLNRVNSFSPPPSSDLGRIMVEAGDRSYAEPTTTEPTTIPLEFADSKA